MRLLRRDFVLPCPSSDLQKIPITEMNILMKSILAVAVLTMTTFSLGFGQTKDKSNKQSGNVEQTLMHIEQELDDAVVKGDTSPSEKYLADNSTFTDPGGMVMDKARNIDDVKS